MHPIRHFITVTRHRWLVLCGCFRLGLYYQGLTHDLSKYSPAEFLIGAKYYFGDHSPNDGERREKGYSSAWLHHKGRNKHHLEYWVDYSLEGGTPHMAGLEMPVRYVAEMFCDRLAASKIYRGADFTPDDPYNYFRRGKSHIMIHPKTAALLEDMLIVLRDHGERAAFEHIKHDILKKK